VDPDVATVIAIQLNHTVLRVIVHEGDTAVAVGAVGRHNAKVFQVPVISIH
jgi:hypothetical protein